MKNTDKVLRLIKEEPNITRFQISRRLQLDLVEVGEAIRTLEKQELIERNEELWS